ncbi:glycosyltransferase family 2 protein [Flexibacterium corallicola]|uniref:glycosyltransferase family 2 protein n=1 Tax=Flexibacterium corallicola TaxID=3037259 RepID=UPI00286F1256|nr:glycosyltransferase family A protein [Pseudovibrio sp. M1P-2-3]
MLNLATRWNVSYSKSNDGKKGGLPPARVDQDIDNNIKIEVIKEVRWLRLEYAIDVKVLSSRELNLKFNYRALGPVHSSGPSLKILEYKNHFGQRYSPISGPISRTGTSRQFSKEIILPHPPCEGAEYRLAFEFRKPVTFWLDSFELKSGKQTASQNVKALQLDPLKTPPKIPYRSFNSQTSKLLRSLNDDMNNQLRKDPASWVRNMTFIALEIEDYKTAHRLTKYFLQKFRGNTEALKDSQDVLLKTLVGVGDLKTALNFLRHIASCTELSDSSHQLAHTLCPPEDNSHATDYILPSGKVDVFNLSRRLEKRKDITFHQMLVATPKGPDAFLLWANYYLHQCEEDYVRQTNLFLEHFNSPISVSLGSYSDNILGRLNFNKKAPLKKLKKKPLVSIIITTYNNEATIEHAIGSLLRQDYSNIEILICDDGSTDSTQTVINGYECNKRVRIFSSKSNQGPYNIKNKMIEKSKGDLVTFHSSDAIALPHRITQQVFEITDNGAQVSMASGLRIKKDGHYLVLKNGSFLQDCLNSLMFSKDTFGSFGPYREVLYGAQSEFYEHLKNALHPSHFTILKEPLMFFLWDSPSLAGIRGLEVDEIGFLAKSRREYSAISGRQRTLGTDLVPDEQVLNIMKSEGLYRQPQPVEEVH